MIRALEFAAFGLLATGLHVVAVSQWDASPAGDAPASAGGASESFALAAADPRLMDLVAEWETPPEAVEAVPSSAPVTEAVPPAPEVAVPVASRSQKAPGGALLPAPATAAPLRQPARAAELRPRSRPEDLRVARAGPVPATSGNAGRAAAPARPAAAAGDRAAALEEAHAAAVRAALVRARTYPPQARDQGISGRPVLDLEIDGSGRLRAVALAQSSGSEILDRASLAAAGRARFPAAPPELKRDRFAYRVGITYALD